MERPKNFLFAVVLVSVLAVALAAAAIHAARERQPAARPAGVQAVDDHAASPTPVSDRSGSNGTPSAAAQKRAKDFNDATSRFNAPDDQQH